MEMTNLKVLLVGWDEALPAGEPGRPSTLLLARALAAHTQLAVLLPRLPKNEADLPHPAHVTGVGNLPLQEVEAADAYRPSEAGRPLRAPAFPYVGASTPPAAKPAAPPAAQPPATTPGLLDPDEFVLQGAEPGATEANDLDYYEADLMPAAPAPAPAPQAAHLNGSPPRASHADALAVLSVDAADADGLNFRVIQYARFATRMALREQFAVIYAADWPAWLAALEIRQRTGRPLVLHVHALAATPDAPTDRGWITELERMALRQADLVIVDSQAQEHRLTSRYNLEKHRVRIQPVSLTPELLAESVRGVLEEAAHS